MFLCVSVQPVPLSVCRGSHGRAKGLPTEAIKRCVCWNNVFHLAVVQQQVLGGPAWSCCSPPALIWRPGTSLPLLWVFPSRPIFVFLLPCLCFSALSVLLLSLTIVIASISLSFSFFFCSGSSALPAALLT